MKFTIARDRLLKALQLATGVVERRQTLPVLANLLIKANADGVALTGTDLEVEMVARTDVDVEQPGEITIPARKLADIWRALPDGSDVSVSVEGDRATVKSGRSRFTLATLPANDFPEIEGGETDVVVSVAQADLRALIDQVGFAMAQQDVRYFLNGMLFEVTEDHLRTVATDGHRLAMCTKGCTLESPIAARRQAIVPRKAVLELSRLLDEEDEAIRIQLGSNHLRVTKGPFTLTTKLVDGQFPDYDKVVPKDASRTLVGDRDTLRQGFQRASILSNEKYRGVRLAIASDQLTIQANNPEQEEAEEVVPVEFNGSDLEIGFNVSYLLDVLSVMSAAGVKLSVSDANSSALLESATSDDALYVVMPMRL
ncbi:MAG: DNA polymerase III subunit beta [Gammaproteobacteria bacterium]|jgi:DNA polymerase-3 subunit beta|nr:DNA polymerase III subunit beta [Gammaproteobacteria bacterium]|tara:strand:+ start:255 stop:1361 length:1107 start_codon:yes stop_codon:yes gene_type:complete